MEPPELELRLIAAGDDSPLRSPAYQQDLREFERSLGSRGLKVSSAIAISESGSPDTLAFIVPTYLGDFSIKLAGIIGTALATVIGAWLHAKYGRKVRVKVGEIEAEAQTVEEVKKLLDRAQEIQQCNRTKVIP
jgi:hypothetical protein